MKRTKIIYSNYDNNTGVSTITIQTPKGRFTGISLLHDEDKDYASEITGCSYAEIKAHMKMVAADIKELKSNLSAFEKFYNNISTSNSFDEKSYIARKLRKEIFRLKEKINLYEQLKTAMHNTLMSNMENRQKKLEAFYRKVNRIKGQK